MPLGLIRYHHSREYHFVTTSCYRRLRRFADPRLCELFLKCLEQTRTRFKLRVFGYVIMPEHVHLILSAPKAQDLAMAIKSLKLSVSKLAVGLEHRHFWMPRYFDSNVSSHEAFMEVLRYIHRNPVKRGLVKKPEEYRWSSFRHYAFGEVLPVEIEWEWTARLRQGTGNRGKIPT